MIWLDFDQVVLHITYNQDSWSEMMKRHPTSNPDPWSTHIPYLPQGKWDECESALNYKVLNQCERLMVTITCDLDRSVSAAHGIVSLPLALNLCKLPTLKIQDQTWNYHPSLEMHTIIQSSLFLFSFVRKTGCVREQMHGGVLQGRQPKAVCKPLSFSSFVMALSSSQAFAWQSSWVDFSQTWMIIGIDSYVPWQSPESALLFMFDLLSAFWKKAELRTHFSTSFSFSPMTASVLQFSIAAN